MDKSTLRALIMGARKQFAAHETADQRSVRGDAIAELGIRLSQLNAPSHTGTDQPAVVASYEALATEPPTNELNDALLRAGFQVLVPIHERDGCLLDDMLWADAETGTVTAASPEAFQALGVQVVFTPAIAVGADGTRLGKGNGFYDRFFATLPRYPDGPFRVAIVGPAEAFDSVPTDAHDQPIDDVVVG